MHPLPLDFRLAGVENQPQKARSELRSGGSSSQSGQRSAPPGRRTAMPPPYLTPRVLVEALHKREAGAREQLWQWLRAPIVRLMDKLIAQHRLEQDRERLVLHALHAVEMHL